MAKLRIVNLWGIDEDPAVAAFSAPARAIGELFSEGLRKQDLHSLVSEVRVFVRSGEGPDAVLDVHDIRGSGFDSGLLLLPSAVAHLELGATQLLVLDVLVLLGRRMTEVRGWPAGAVEEARRHVLENHFEARWTGPWKASPGRRLRARVGCRIDSTGAGWVQLEIDDAQSQHAVARSDPFPAFYNHYDGFRRISKTMRWTSPDTAEITLHRFRDSDVPLRLSAVDGIGRIEAAHPMQAAVPADTPRPAVVLAADGPSDDEPWLTFGGLSGGPEHKVWRHDERLAGAARRAASAYAAATREPGRHWISELGFEALSIDVVLSKDEKILGRTSTFRHHRGRSDLVSELWIDGKRMKRLPDGDLEASLLDAFEQHVLAVARRRKAGEPPVAGRGGRDELARLLSAMDGTGRTEP